MGPGTAGAGNRGAANREAGDGGAGDRGAGNRGAANQGATDVLMSAEASYDVVIVGAGHNAAREMLRDFKRRRVG